jgi:predicted nucleic acid-binding protein
LELLPQLAEAVLVPRGVLDEIAAKDDQRLAESIASHAGFTVTPDEPMPVALAEWDLGRGECYVIAHAVTRPALIAVLDDRRARQAAQAFGLRVTGTLGILVRARRTGLIAAMEPVIAAMRSIGFYASDAVVREVLASVGERLESDG